MSISRPAVLLLFALVAAGPTLAVDEPAAAGATAAAGEVPKGPALFLLDGTVKPCLEAPVLAFGRAVYTTPDGVRHSTSLDLVDVEKTRAHARTRVAERELGAAPSPKEVAGRRAAPDFVLDRPNGETLQLSDLRGKVVLIDFWATWCGPCVRALPELLGIATDYQGKGFEVVGVSLDGSREAFENFQRSKRMTFPQYFDGKKWDNEVARAYGVRSIPRTVLLDVHGNIAHQNLKGQGLRAAIDRLLEEGAAAAAPAATP